jgi:hypothetical protein
VDYREATAGDVEAIAALHADSWRRHYRSAYLDSYLDGDVFADLRTVWTDRLTRRASAAAVGPQVRSGSPGNWQEEARKRAGCG